MDKLQEQEAEIRAAVEAASSEKHKVKMNTLYLDVRLVCCKQFTIQHLDLVS